VIHKICRYGIILLSFVGASSRASEWCHDVTEGIPRTITGAVRLHVSSQYAFGYDDIKRVVDAGGGIDCRHTRPAARTELLACSNGLRAVGTTKDRLCTTQEKYGSDSSNRAICALTGGTIPETDWKITDKIGQAFNDYDEDWESHSPVRGCVLSSSGKYERRGYKALGLTAGDYKLYFVREELDVYDPKRQPSF